MSTSPPSNRLLQVAYGRIKSVLGRQFSQQSRLQPRKTGRQSPYPDWAQRVFGNPLTSNIQDFKLTCCYPEKSAWFDKCYAALLEIEQQYVRSLLTEIRDRDVPGAIAEFGVYQGNWINHLFEVTEDIGLDREIWGFDSFKGLSKPNPQFDISFWQEGMYATSLAEVRTRVGASQRSRIKLVEGFFSDSLHGANAQSLGLVCYARIDCDLYEPAVECLRYLSNRLSDGAILVFDDWTL